MEYAPKRRQLRDRSVGIGQRPGGVLPVVRPPPVAPIRYKDRRAQERDRREREAAKYVQDYIVEHGIHPVLHKIQRARRAKGSAGPPPAEAAASSMSESERRRRRKERRYHAQTVHGGFERRAARAVSGVPRDKAARIVNYGEVTRHTEVEDGWVLIDHEKFGPHISGAAGRSPAEAGPHCVANPDCADPQVQDGIHDWLKTQRAGDRANGRRESRADVQFYDDKDPCPTCAKNIPAQVQNDRLHLDLFQAKHQDVDRGRYSGARFHSSYRPVVGGPPLPLVTRGRGRTNSEHAAFLRGPIEGTEREMDRLHASATKKFSAAVRLRSSGNHEGADRVEGRARTIMRSVSNRDHQLRVLRAKQRAAAHDWPTIRKPDHDASDDDSSE